LKSPNRQFPPIRHIANSPGVGALYRTFDRLEDKGYRTSWFGDPTAARGGRSRRYFKIAPAGVRALRESREALTAMWDGLEARLRHGS